MGSTIVEYWTKKKCIASVVTTYVPLKGDWVSIKHGKNLDSKMYQVVDIFHKINSSNTVTLENFVVVLK